MCMKTKDEKSDISEGPRMCMKTKDEKSDILEGPTIYMKIKLVTRSICRTQ